MVKLLTPTDTSQATLGYLLEDGSIPLTADWDVGAFNIKFEDNKGIILGTGDDASIVYDGGDLVLSPRLTGTGAVEIAGLGANLRFTDTGTDHIMSAAGVDTIVFTASGLGLQLNAPVGLLINTAVLRYGNTDSATSLRDGNQVPWLQLSSLAGSATREFSSSSGSVATTQITIDDSSPEVTFANDVLVSGTLAVTGTITGPSGTWDSGGMDLAAFDSYAVAGNDVLTGSTLGSQVVNSSLTSVGTLLGLTVNGKLDLSVLTDNIVIGTNAGANLTGTALRNVFIGNSAGNAMLETDDTVMIGDDAGLLNTAADNIFIGSSAGAANVTTAGNVFIGKDAGKLNVAANNIFIGLEAGKSANNSSAANNVCIGLRAGDAITSGAQNILIGVDTGGGLSTGNKAICIGHEAGKVNTASDNIFIGSRAGDANTSGGANVFIGRDCGTTNITGANNLYFGTQAGKVATGSSGIFLGSSAGLKNTSGAQNVFIGKEAGRENLTGANIICMGTSAGLVNTASDNTFIGTRAGDANTSGTENTFIGGDVGGANITNDGTSCFGFEAGLLSKGDDNLYLGRNAGDSMVTGARNIFLGSGVDASTDSFDTSIGIGFNTSVTASNQMVLGSADANGAITDAYIGSGVTKASPGGIVLNATGGSGTDNAGAAFTLAGGKGTGNAAGGSLLLQTADVGSSGTTLQSLSTRVTINPLASGPTVDINGGLATNLVAKTGAYTATNDDHVITCDASGGAFTVTLPAASGVTGIIYHIKKTDSSGNAVTVDGNSSETIDGATTKLINVQYDSMMIICDGSNWHII